MGGQPQLRLFGIPVRIELFFVISAVLLGADLKPKYLLYWVLIVFVSVLVHELGHAIAYRITGSPARIVLTGFVGLTFGRPPGSPAKRIAISLAGSLTQIAVLGLPARFLRDQLTPWQDLDRWWVLDTIVFVSIGWALLNLVPILPLDGGHVVEEVIGRERARYVSVGAAVLTFLWMRKQGYGFTFLPLFLGVLNVVEIVQARQGNASFRLLPDEGGDFFTDAPARRRSPRRQRGGRAVPAQPALQVVRSDDQVEALAWDALRRGDIGAAQRALARLPGTGRTDPYLLASVDLAGGDVGDALARFRRAYLADPNGPRSLVPAQLLSATGRATELASALLADRTPAGPRAGTSLQAHLHYAGAYEAAAQVGELVHADGRANRAQAAFEVACSSARAGRPADGLRWLTRAIDDGFNAPTLVDGEPDLASVRALPAYAEVRRRLR